MSEKSLTEKLATHSRSSLLDLAPEHLKNPDPNIYWSNNYVVLDFETTNIDKGNPYREDNRLVLSCWTHLGVSHSLRGSEFDIELLVTAIEQADFLVAHNAKFELGWLERAGLDLSRVVVWCTQIGEHVLAGNRGWRTNLNACCARRGWDTKEDTVNRLIKAGVCPSEIPPSWLQRYCEIDVALTHRLFLSQRESLSAKGLLPVMYCRCLLTPVLADIEKQGMVFDKERVDRLFLEYTEKLRLLELEFEELTGGINPRSRQQMAQFLYEDMGFRVPTDYRGNELRTSKGLPQTNKEAISKLKPRNKKQLRFVNLYKEISKTGDVLSKYVRKMADCCEENDGLLQASLNQTQTQTHRLSSTGQKYKIQFQNIQRELKRTIKAREEGWLIGESDYAQLEFRAAVDMARCEAGIQAVIDKEDVHALSASVLFDEWSDESISAARRKEIRTAAKADTFKPLYGGSSGTAKQQEYYQAFKDKYRGVAKWQQDNKCVVLQTGRLTIPSGLIFYFPDTKVTKSGYITNTPNICNYPVQSFATADMVPLGVVWLWHLLRVLEAQTFLVNTVHDSAISEVHPEEVEEYKQIASTAMVDGVLKSLKDLYNYNFITPLDVDHEIYPHWGDKS